MDGGSHYAVLGLTHEASLEEIRKAHRALALKWHPDKAGDWSSQGIKASRLFECSRRSWKCSWDFTVMLVFLTRRLLARMKNMTEET